MPDDRDRVWAGSMPQAYDRWLAPAVFRPFAIDLARRAARFAPRRLLEIAAGTGVLTRELVAAVPAAQVTATDLNAAMVEFGSRQVPLATWRQADALRLPFDDRTFDLIACQFGVMFFPDRPAAFREMRRVLAPAGRLLFSTWGAVETHGFEAALAAGLGPRVPRRPPGVRGRGAARLLRPRPGRAPTWPRAGWNACPPSPSRWRDAPPRPLTSPTGFCTGTPLRTAIEARGDLAAYTARVADQMTARLGPGPVTAKMTAYVIEARPPQPAAPEPSRVERA